MKTLFKLFLLSFLFLGCSKEDDSPQKSDISIESVTPARVRAGETVIIKGSNLDLLKNIYFRHQDDFYSLRDIKIPSQNFQYWDQDMVQVKIPAMNHENIKVVAGSAEFPLELYGVIRMVKPLPEKIQQVQVLDEKIAFLRTGKQLYKSTDGYYTWELVVDYPDNHITSFFFTDEDRAWLAMNDPLRDHALYTSTNGGTDFIHQFRHPDYYSTIRTMKFKSAEEGYYVDTNAIAYEYKNGSARDIYEAYPELKELPYPKLEFYELVLEGDLVFFTPNQENVLVKLDKGRISYSEFPERPGIPQMFEETIYLPSDRSLFKSTDRGETWTSIHHAADWYPQYLFLSEKEGYAYTPYDGGRFFRTEDGGESWIAEDNENPSFQLHSIKDFSGSTGLFGNSQHLTKYIPR